ncbi:MAG: FAD-dependent oxidoreductase [Acidimicrobiia bacterium]|nr:FAD-dependent oxidoreductase [Acidimicrobiia bacterium]
MTRHDPRIAVVGGGISGLSAALELALGTEGRADIALLESQERTGGVIRTSEFAGLPVDEGADAFLRRVPDALEVAAAVGMRYIAVSAVLPLQLLKTRQELWITNNLPAASVFTHVGQMPIGIDDQRGHGGNWRRLVDGDALLLQIHPVCVL